MSMMERTGEERLKNCLYYYIYQLLGLFDAMLDT